MGQSAALRAIANRARADVRLPEAAVGNLTQTFVPQPILFPPSSQHVNGPIRVVPAIVAQHKLLPYTTRTEHWNVPVLKTLNDALVLEVVGNSDTFTYVPADVHNFARSLHLCGGCLVGRIAVDRLAWLTERLRAAPCCATTRRSTARLSTEDTSERYIGAELKLEEER
ncbi:hypothetical protein B0H10DRAFT_2211496 [Mycena sp. CBHHK59/15]|nr:hypothetical protein B0H10DRAFT_2211496 [Mycena sp. CBHHK59/15]